MQRSESASALPACASPRNTVSTVRGAGFAAGRLIKAADSHAIIEAAKPDDGKPAVTPPLSFAPADQSNALALSAVGSADSRSEMS